MEMMLEYGCMQQVLDVTTDSRTMIDLIFPMSLLGMVHWSRAIVIINLCGCAWIVSDII